MPAFYHASSLGHRWVSDGEGKLPRCSACFAVRYSFPHWGMCLMKDRQRSKHKLIRAIIRMRKAVDQVCGKYESPCPPWRNRREKHFDRPICGCVTSKRNSRRGEISRLRRDRRIDLGGWP